MHFPLCRGSLADWKMSSVCLCVYVCLKEAPMSPPFRVSQSPSLITPPAGTVMAPPILYPPCTWTYAGRRTESWDSTSSASVSKCACLTVLVFCPRRQRRQRDELVAPNHHHHLLPINLTSRMPCKSKLVTQGNSEAKMGRGSHNGTTGIHQ